MKNIIKILFILSLINSSIYAAKKGALVVSKDVNIESISKNDLKDILLGRKTLWNNGSRIRIAISSEDSEKLNQFLIDNIEQNKRRFKKYWLKRVFAGYGIAPKIFKNDEKALNYAQSQENSITYMTIEEDKVPSGVTIVSVE